MPAMAKDFVFAEALQGLVVAAGFFKVAAEVVPGVLETLVCIGEVADFAL